MEFLPHFLNIQVNNPEKPQLVCSIITSYSTGERGRNKQRKWLQRNALCVRKERIRCFLDKTLLMLLPLHLIYLKLYQLNKGITKLGEGTSINCEKAIRISQKEIYHLFIVFFCCDASRFDVVCKRMCFIYIFGVKKRKTERYLLILFKCTSSFKLLGTFVQQTE